MEREGSGRETKDGRGEGAGVGGERTGMRMVEGSRDMSGKNLVGRSVLVLNEIAAPDATALTLS